MPIQCIQTLKCWLALSVMGLAILGCLGQEPDRIPGRNVTSNSLAGKKGCFIVDPLKLPPQLKTNPNIVCTQDGSMSIPPIPDLFFEGIKYSSIDFARDTQNSPAGFALKRFKASKTDGPEKLAFLKTSQQLYDSVWMGLRSDDLKKHNRPIRELETVRGFLNLQIHRLESDPPAIEAALANALKKCFQCGVKDSYNMIALASQSGVNTDKFLQDLPGLRCKSEQECINMLSKSGFDNKAPVEVASPDKQKKYITSNPALNNSSHLKLTFSSASKFSVLLLPLYAFCSF
ncbi:hypothetical protein PGTUg99_004625 [Puccinia graminis f. sp. tritici]|uniref:DUF7143 domain-containing protein n=3 Tax=Puccinia graminis f. sp. tritici TaxID=56615 RepID=A0A5B0PED3_PUCGR|nr:hypothetical protein PGTUg99_004625 [Puccinia graminis f. sp. tritici]